VAPYCMYSYEVIEILVPKGFALIGFRVARDM
jgi:hypothetical protein